MTGQSRPDLPSRMAALLQRSTHARAAACAALHRADRALEASSRHLTVSAQLHAGASRPTRGRLILTDAQRTTMQQALLEQAEIDGQVKSTGLRHPHLARPDTG